MVAQVGGLRVAVGADITGLQTGMKRAERQVQQSAGVMQRAVGGINKSLSGLGTVAGLSLGAAGLAVGARAFLSVADAAKTMTAQLKLATAEYGSFAQASKDVRNIAEESRSSLTSVATLYSAIQRNAGELGNTQAQTARITETVTKSFAVYGATTMEAEQATRQLIQAFQSGRLMGDEFRSLMENSPRLVRMLADSLGVPIGKLRELSKEGELTSDKLVAAFSDLKLTEELDKEFAQMPVTFDQAMTGVYNAAIVTFSAFDRGGQFSNSIANFIIDGTRGFQDLEDSAFNFGRSLSDLFSALDVVRVGIGNMHGDGIGAFSAMTDWAFTFQNALRGVLSLLDSTIEAYARVFNAPGNALWGAFGRENIVYDSRFAENFDERTRDKRTGPDRFSGMFRGGTGRTPPPFKAPPGKAKKAKKTREKKPPRDRSEDVTYQFENELRQAQMDLLRAQQSLAKDYVQRSDISLRMLDLEKIQFEAELADRLRRAQRDLAEGKITETAFRQAEVQAEALRAANNEADAIKRQAISQEVIERSFEDRVRLADAELTNEQDILQSQSTLATTASEQREIQLRLLDLSYRQERARLRSILAEESGATIAEKDEAQMRLAALSEITANQRQGVINSTRGPWEEYVASLPGDAAKMEEALEQVRVNGVESLTAALVDTISGVKSLGDAFKDVAKQIMMDLIRIQIQKMLVGALSGALGGLGGIFGGGGISESGALYTDPLTGIPTFAGGGSFSVFGRGGTDRNVLALNGLPIARVSHGERVNIANDNVNGGGARVFVEASPYFDVRVEGMAKAVATPLAGRAAVMGAAGAGQRSANMARRQIP